MAHRFAISTLSVLLVAGLAGSVHGQPGRFDESTGRDLASYPRQAQVDFRHMKLNILIPDMNVRRMEIVQELSFTPVIGEKDQIRLDAKLMQIHSVTSSIGRATFEHDGQFLTVTLDTPVRAGEVCTLTTTYTVTEPPHGMVWTPESPLWPGRPAQLHSKGQPENNSYWFPCHDFPNDRLSTEIIATVPAAYEVISNGELLKVENRALSTRDATGRTQADSRLGMYRRWHWKQELPHVPYLVTFVVGRFDVVDVHGKGKVPLPVYAPVGRGPDAKPNFRNTERMIAFFERTFDEKYPWDQYAQVLVHNYASGATENTSATSFADGAIWSPEGLVDHDPDGLIAHELAHQWFGDLLTCRSWEHIWINEAWATYSEALWFGERDGPIGYEAEIVREFQSTLSGDKGTSPHDGGMVSKYFTTPREVFSRSASPYSKGSSILHMLRKKVGDEAFFKATAMYVDKFRLKETETFEFQAMMEEVSGEALDQFFTQWCTRPGHPRLRGDVSWDSSTSSLRIAVQQTQKIDGANPAYEFDLPVSIRHSDGSVTQGVVPVRGREASVNLPLASEPAWVEFAPQMEVLAEMEFHAPAAWLRAEARQGSSLAARRQAIRDLAQIEEANASRLCEVVIFDGAEHELVKLEAVAALKKLKDFPTLETCLLGRLPQYAVREAAASAIADVASKIKGDMAERRRQRAADLLVKLYGADASSKVRAACIRGLGTLESHEQQPLILAAARAESPADRVRQAAIRSLADLDTPEGLAVAIEFAGEGANDRTRAVAFDALAKLKKHDPDAAFEQLAAAVRQAPDRTRRAAGRAMVDFGEERGLDLMQELHDASIDNFEREMLAAWIKELREKLTPKEKPAEAEAPAGS
ncbi:MAG TPA: M1 family metallopeptidase [Phycisphaerales bacterium]|nr:M1 family metallopeptidase [Phycisphaerales bacterium]